MEMAWCFSGWNEKNLLNMLDPINLQIFFFFLFYSVWRAVFGEWASKIDRKSNTLTVHWATIQTTLKMQMFEMVLVSRLVVDIIIVWWMKNFFVCLTASWTHWIFPLSLVFVLFNICSLLFMTLPFRFLHPTNPPRPYQRHQINECEYMNDDTWKRVHNRIVQKKHIHYSSKIVQHERTLPTLCAI